MRWERGERNKCGPCIWALQKFMRRSCTRLCSPAINSMFGSIAVCFLYHLTRPMANKQKSLLLSRRYHPITSSNPFDLLFFQGTGRIHVPSSITPWVNSPYSNNLRGCPYIFVVVVSCVPAVTSVRHSEIRKFLSL